MKAWIISLALLASPAAALAQTIGGTPFLAVHGSARVDVVPDVFPVSLVIADTGLDVAKSQALVESLTREAIAQARKAGLDDAAITVGDLDIAPDETYDPDARKQVFRGNRYSRSLGLRFHDLAALKQFVAAVPSGKNVRLSADSFRVSTENEIRRRLLVDAIADARKTADVLASGIGRKVRQAQTISTSPMTLSAGSYINAIDAEDVESSSILTAEQIARIPVPRDITSIGLLAPGTVRSAIALEKGAVTLGADVYIVYLLGD
jgi:uncharacterized protein YggE